MAPRDISREPSVVGTGHCPACGARDSFVITASQDGDVLTVMGSCTVCGHKREGSSLVGEEEFLEAARAYYTAFLIRSFYLGENEELYECPYCDGFYVVTTARSGPLVLVRGECEDCHYSRSAVVTGEEAREEALEWVLDTIEEEAEGDVPESEREKDDSL